MFEWLKALMGQSGMALLRVYEANSLWINLLVLVYGAWVVVSWVNLKKIRTVLIRALMRQMADQADLPAGEGLKTPYVIPWEEAISQVRFPFVAQQSALLPRRLTVQAVQSMLPADDLKADALHIVQLQKHPSGRVATGSPATSPQKPASTRHSTSQPGSGQPASSKPGSKKRKSSGGKRASR
jgi:hypothetical protein